MSLVDLGKRLLDAAKKGDTEEVRTLMSNGAPFTTDWFGHVTTAEVLLRAGISRDARTKVDRTPLHVAAQEGHGEIVDLLMRHGADVEAKDMLKMSPLHWAVEKGHVPVMRQLLKHGCDINSLNKFDKSPVEIAMSNGRTDLAQLLQMSSVGDLAVYPGGDIPIGDVAADTPQNIEEVCTSGQDGLGNTLVISAKETDASTAAIMDDGTNFTIKTDGSDQDSTSVLATLAALAEATGPMNTPSGTGTTPAEAISWLETHGITMISNADTPTIVTSSIEGGQTLTLTEAGKLALNFVQQKPEPGEGEEEVVNEEQEEVVHDMGEHLEGGVEEEVVDESQNVVTIVTNEEDVGTDANSMVIIAPEDIGNSHAVIEEQQLEEQPIEPPLKKAKIEKIGDTIYVTTDGPIDPEDLKRQLEAVSKEAAAYKQQLREKEEEAEEYKKKLSEIASQDDS